MPALIRFMITRLATGFAIGAAAGMAIWWNGFDRTFQSGGADLWVAQGLFIYVFGSSLALGYLATALVQDDA